jgi:hypothetical protein
MKHIFSRFIRAALRIIALLMLALHELLFLVLFGRMLLRGLGPWYQYFFMFLSASAFFGLEGDFSEDYPDLWRIVLDLRRRARRPTRFALLLILKMPLHFVLSLDLVRPLLEVPPNDRNLAIVVSLGVYWASMLSRNIYRFSERC